MIKKLLAALQSTTARVIFLVLALAFGAWAVISQWDSLVDAVTLIEPWLLLVAFACSVLYVMATFLAWRTLLRAQNSGLSLGQAARVFFVSQLGKYLPGGIWNIVAAAELGRDHQISRVHSVVVMVQSTLVSIATGLILGAIGLLVGPPALWERAWWALLALPIFLAVLTPAAVNRITAFLLKKTKRGHIEVRTTWSSIARAAAWSVLGWILAGLQVWVIGSGLGLDPSVASMGLAVLAYALAWTVGFLFIAAPAGIGVREGVLGILLAGYLSGGALVALVLLSRILLTVADVVLGVAFLRPRRPTASNNPHVPTPTEGDNTPN